MAHAFILSDSARNAACNTVVDLVDIGGPGRLAIYDGTKPADPQTAVTTQTKLAELPLDSTAFDTATNGSAALNTVDSTLALANGTAAWFRIFDGNDTPIADGTVGTAEADLTTRAVDWTTGSIVQIVSLTLLIPTE